MDLNKTAQIVYQTAINRGKISKTTHKFYRIIDISNEVKELKNAHDYQSIHMASYTARQEEAADVIISTLSFLADENIDIEKLIEDKMEFNSNRENSTKEEKLG